MAKITITIEDTVTDEIKVGFEFDPPMKKDELPTSAQSLAFILGQAMQDELETKEAKVNGDPV